MKLRNKITGFVTNWCIDKDVIRTCDGSIKYNSLAELNEEWEDYNEPFGPRDFSINDNVVLIGYASNEEAKKGLNRLEALTRLRKNGFKFDGWSWDDTQGHYILEGLDFIMDKYDGCEDDLQLLFSKGKNNY